MNSCFDIPPTRVQSPQQLLADLVYPLLDRDRFILTKVSICAVIGLDGALVDVEIDVSNGRPGLTMVGLPSAAVQESRERVRATIKKSFGLLTIQMPYRQPRAS